MTASVLLVAAPRAAAAAPLVWALDDGDKIKRDAIDSPRSKGIANAVWSPGQPIRLFALRNETVAFQVVVQADQTALDGVSVDLAEMVGPGGASIRNGARASDPSQFVDRSIERFVEHYFELKRPSGNSAGSDVSLGWHSGSAPAVGAFTGVVPDALIPVEVAPAWDPYPMHIAPESNGAVWIDVTIAPDQAPGTYRGNVVVQAGGSALATLPVELEVAAATLPDHPAMATMLYYGRDELTRRIGAGAAAEKQLWQLFHRHRLSAMHSAKTIDDLLAQEPALDGSAFTRAEGYEGPGDGKGDGILSLGTYGTYGDPNPSLLSNVESIADRLQAKGVLDSTDVFIYASDEDCGSPRGPAWKSLVASSTDPNLKKVRVGWTCSQSPADQPVDLPIVVASRFDPVAAAAAADRGKKVWIYNGSFPETGTFLTDVEATSPRMNGWIGGMFDIGRWFYWETTFWYDDNRGGKGAYDPFVVAETFHNQDGDYCEGDGVLVYPGKQIDQFTEHSIGFDGVLPSMRLKNLRRGVEDAGYYALARAAAPKDAAAIGSALLPNVLTNAKKGDPLAAADVAKSFFDARKRLLDLIPRDAAPGGPASAGSLPPHAGTGSSTDAGAPLSHHAASATVDPGGSASSDAGPHASVESDAHAPANAGVSIANTPGSRNPPAQGDAGLVAVSQEQADVGHAPTASCSVTLRDRSGVSASYLGILGAAMGAVIRRRRRSARSV